jgi:hypothetical protein
VPRSEAFRIGDYFLGKRRNSGQWCGCWFDPCARQTVRRNLGTGDFRAAQVELARFVSRHGEIRHAEPSSMTVAQLLERHHARHVKATAQPDVARHARRLLEHFGDALVSDLTPAAQARFVAAMKAAGRSGSYIDRILDTLRTVLSRARGNEEITSAPTIATVQRDPYERRLLGREEIAALWSAAEE